MSETITIEKQLEYQIYDCIQLHEKLWSIRWALVARRDVLGVTIKYLKNARTDEQLREYVIKANKLVKEIEICGLDIVITLQLIDNLLQDNPDHREDKVLDSSIDYVSRILDHLPLFDTVLSTPFSYEMNAIKKAIISKNRYQKIVERKILLQRCEAMTDMIVRDYSNKTCTLSKLRTNSKRLIRSCRYISGELTSDKELDERMNELEARLAYM